MTAKPGAVLHSWLYVFVELGTALVKVACSLTFYFLTLIVGCISKIKIADLHNKVKSKGVGVSGGGLQNTRFFS